MPQAVQVKDRKVRYAVVGIGWISQSSMLPGIEHTGNSEVVAFVTGHEEKAQKVAEKYDVHAIYSYDEYDQLLASGTVDAVYLATPNFDHTELAVKTLDAGVHLLLEKPMATSVEDCAKITAASVRTGAKLMIAYRLHHEPGMLAAIEAVHTRKLGKLRYFNSSFSQPVSGQNHRAKSGFWAGPVPDMGPYPINTVRNLFSDEPIEVFAMGTQTDARFNFDDTVVINLRFAHNRLATMVLSYNAQDVDDYRIVGELGSIYSDPAFQVNKKMHHTLMMGTDKTSQAQPETEHFGGEMKYFSGCILEGKDPEADGEEGMLDVRVLEAVEQSLITGKSIALEPYTRTRRPVPDQVERLSPVKEPALVDSHKPSEGQ